MAGSLPVVRPYLPEDREAVRRICADTGFLGKPIDPVFEDRELFADYLTGYYTDAEPESTFVTVSDGEVKGYMMASLHPRRKARYEAKTVPWLVLRGAWRYPRYRTASRRFVRWVLTQARKEIPFTPPDLPHIHFNLLPEARNVQCTRLLVDTCLAYLAAQGAKGVYGQVVSYGTRRSERLFARYGFRVVDQREVTKYREFYPDRVQLFTIVKDLTANPVLYGLDLHKTSDS
jgi:hypothetical protein